MKNQPKDIIFLLEYEVSNSWIAKYVSWPWLQDLIGSYYANKVRRKYLAYVKFKTEKQMVKSILSNSNN